MTAPNIEYFKHFQSFFCEDSKKCILVCIYIGKLYKNVYTLVNFYVLRVQPFWNKLVRPNEWIA